MRLVITGGAGFIGSNLVRLAVAQGSEVVVVDDLSTGSAENLAGLPARFCQASILDHETLAAALRGADSVIHLAALPSVPRSIRDPAASHAANATGTLMVLEACRRVSIAHVIVASSSSVYGMNPSSPKNERDWIRPLSPYAVSKLATEQYTLAYQQSFGLNTVAFRFFNVYGPGQSADHAYAAVIPVFLQALLAGHPIPLHGDGEQSRDFTYVDTVCQILLSAASKRLCHPEPINLAYGTNTSLIELIAVMETVTGLQSTIQDCPPRAGDVRHSRADNQTLLNLFPDIEPTSLESGVRKTAEWLHNRAGLRASEGRSLNERQ
jgi:UDP-glucose 4-epimerase